MAHQTSGKHFFGIDFVAHNTMNYEFYDVCFRYLVEKDASVAAVNNDGELPFDIAEGDEMEAFLETEMQNKGK